MGIKVFDRTYLALERALDLRAENQAIISSNVANADTPGYQAQELDFERALSKAIDTKRESAIGRVRGEIHNQLNNVVREDGNTVDREMEMMAMSKNQLLFDAAAELVKKKLAMIKYSITEGGGSH